MRPDPTPPDDTLFPISPCHTAELDARAVDVMAEVLTQIEFKPRSLRISILTDAQIQRIYDAVIATGREV